jgi:hypothetical protein
MKKIRFLRSGGGDWVGLYVDGKLITEGHSISEEEMVRLLLPKADIKTLYGSEDLEEYGNHCPSEWTEDLKKYE